MCRFVCRLLETMGFFRERDFFRARARRGDLNTLRDILDQVPDGPVREGDERLA